MMTIFASRNSAAIEGNPTVQRAAPLKVSQRRIRSCSSPRTTATSGDLQDNSALVDEQQPTIVQPDTTSMDHQTRVYENIFEMMPSEENPTPLVRINRLNPHPDFPLYAKLEWMNPFGSVKDRAAWALLRDLEERGELVNGRGLVEPTSGNTGISLASYGTCARSSPAGHRAEQGSVRKEGAC